jgi:hypothetical protein
MLTALNQYRQSGKYLDYGREAAEMASPVSNETRRKYQDRLNQLYTDPTAFLKGNPEFMASMALGQEAMNPANAAKGHHGPSSGKASTDNMRFMSDLSSRYINQERDDLMNAGGFQFNPADGARLFADGARNSLDSEMAAMGSMFFPFLAQARENANGNRPTTPGGGGGPGGGTPGGLGQIASILQSFGRLPNGMLDPSGFGPGGIPGGLEGLFQASPQELDYLENWLQEGGGDPGNALGIGGGTPGLDEIIGGATGGTDGWIGVPSWGDVGDTNWWDGFDWDSIMGGLD